MGLCLLGLAAMKHSSQRLALLVISALVDDGLHGPVSFEDRAGPPISDRIIKAVELDRAEMAAFDPANRSRDSIRG